MKLIGILSLIVFLTYTCSLTTDLPSTFEKELETIRFIDTVIASGGSRISIENISDTPVDRIEITYVIIPTTNLGRQRELTFETVRGQVLSPGDVLTLTAGGAGASGIASVPYYRLRRIRFKEVPF